MFHISFCGVFLLYLCGFESLFKVNRLFLFRFRWRRFFHRFFRHLDRFYGLFQGLKFGFGFLLFRGLRDLEWPELRDNRTGLWLCGRKLWSLWGRTSILGSSVFRLGDSGLDTVSSVSSSAISTLGSSSGGYNGQRQRTFWVGLCLRRDTKFTHRVRSLRGGKRTSVHFGGRRSSSSSPGVVITAMGICRGDRLCMSNRVHSSRSTITRRLQNVVSGLWGI